MECVHLQPPENKREAEIRTDCGYPHSYTRAGPGPVFACSVQTKSEAHTLTFLNYKNGKVHGICDFLWHWALNSSPCDCLASSLPLSYVPCAKFIL